ncbi:MAG TPA: hypothetical protein VM243_18620 [Phycisphaerae bacterium]|nr:hypothetical protein [Phycisphaerae bacterium]
MLDTPRRARAIVLAVVSAAITWFVYVPIHELLHAAGCGVTGGTVTELQIAPHYGGALLELMFPFVVCGGDYAGRLSGFDTGGSDPVYLATDLAPFLLTVFIGVPMLRACTRAHRPVLFGASLVVGLAPVYNLFGDYHEMGSILTTRAAALVTGAPSVEDSPFAALRSDDIFKLIEQIRTQTEQLDLSLSTPMALLLVGVSFVVGVLLALATYALGCGFGRVLAHRQPTTPGIQTNG